jgi:hypothetical protein
MRLRSVTRAVLVLMASAALTVACDDDDDEGGDEHGDDPAVCTEISDACHDLDMGSGMAHECHDTAHGGTAEECEAVHDDCIAFCTGGDTGESGSSG